MIEEVDFTGRCFILKRAMLVIFREENIVGWEMMITDVATQFRIFKAFKSEYRNLEHQMVLDQDM